MKFLLLLTLIISNPVLAEILFEESFENTDYTSRGWYDVVAGGLQSTAEHIDGSTRSLECTFNQGASGCAQRSIGRKLFTETEIVYLTYYIKYSANWQGSNKGYHPHEFYFITNVDSRWIGPAITHLTAYVEQNEGQPLIAIQDALNVDKNCILRNDDYFIGCNGNFSTYVFSENRSVSACNGLMGYLENRDCFAYGDEWYSARAWKADGVYFRDTQGDFYKNDWHRVEAMFELNSIQNSRGVADGKIRYWLDGNLLISSDHILFRTNSHPNMRFNQLIFGPYIGDGSPLQQTFWVDNLTISTHRIHSDGDPAPTPDPTPDPIITPDPPPPTDGLQAPQLFRLR